MHSILITGAASGIGAGLAIELAQGGSSRHGQRRRSSKTRTVVTARIQSGGGLG